MLETRGGQTVFVDAETGKKIPVSADMIPASQDPEENDVTGWRVMAKVTEDGSEITALEPDYLNRLIGAWQMRS